MAAISLRRVFRGLLHFFFGGGGEKNFSGMLVAKFPEVCGCGGILRH